MDTDNDFVLKFIRYLGPNFTFLSQLRKQPTYAPMKNKYKIIYRTSQKSSNSFSYIIIRDTSKEINW